MRRLRLAAVLLALAGPTAAQPAAETPPWEEPAPASTYVPGPRRDLLLTGATVLDGVGGRFTGDVLVRDGKIAAAGPNLARPAGVEVIDAAGRWVTPGLIDIHTHYGTFLLPLGGGEGEASDVLENSDPNVADTWIEHAVRPTDPAFSRALASGVTTVQILPGSGALFGGRTVVVKPVPAVTLAGMRFPGAPQGLKMACGGNPAGSFASRGRAPNSRQGEIAIVKRELEEALNSAEAWEKGASGGDGGRGRRGERPHAKQDTLVAAIRGRLPVHLHCYRADDMATWIETLEAYGLKLAAVHHATEAYKIAPLLTRKGVCAAVWSDWWGFKREAEDGIRENAAFVDAAGGCAMMHSDIPLLGSLLNLEAAKAAAAGRRAGLDIPPERAIRWITGNPAQAMGLGDRIGRIAPGYNADLVLWSADPFSVYAKPDRIWMDGAVVHDGSAPPRPTDFELGHPQREPRR